MIQQKLREQACEANLALVSHGLVVFSFGNASAYDPKSGIMAIKPSGLEYDKLSPEKMVLLEVSTGNKLEKDALRPSSDTATHLVLYRNFMGLGGIVHTHSRRATAWAQSGKDIPCFGTTHADYFLGSIPCTVEMNRDEILGGEGYEHNTGLVIVREFAARNLDPLHVQAVLVRNHAPFVWGKSAADAVHNAVILEYLADMARETLALSPESQAISPALLDKHFKRKHGPSAYYGQS